MTCTNCNEEVPASVRFCPSCGTAAGSSPPPAPPATAGSGAPAAPAAAVPSGDLKRLAQVIIGGGALLVLGSLLPWASVRAFFGTVTVNGTEGDGVITLVIGAVIAFLGFRLLNGLSRKMTIGALVLSVLMVALVIFELADISSAISADEVDDLDVEVNPGTGLYLCGLGAAASTIGSALRLRSRPTEPTVT